MGEYNALMGGRQMMLHDQLDYPHASTWCDQCWAQEQRSQQTTEMRRANDLKQRELDLREWGGWVEPKATPKPRYVLPPPSAPKAQGGGMSVEPRRHSTS